MGTRNNSGSLFKNNKKKGKSQPDYRGSATVEGKDYWLAGWIKEGNGKKFISLAFTEKEQKQDDTPF